ncbi:hypothetical protein [Methanobrevibacter sp.]
MKQKIENKQSELKEQMEKLDKIHAAWNLYENGTIYYNLPLKEDLYKYYESLSGYNWAITYDCEEDYDTFTNHLKYFKNAMKIYKKTDFIHTFNLIDPKEPEDIFDFQVTDEVISLIESICRKLELYISELESELQDLNDELKTEKEMF